MIAVLCGGVGAARMLSGLMQVVDQQDLVAIVNVGDDVELHGLYVSPDIDTITYTLAGVVNRETGWGRAGDTFATMAELGRLGGLTWFSLGDLDLATHLYRTARITEGAPLSAVTAEIARSFGLRLAILPVTDDPVRTRLTVEGGDEITFQEYFVKLRHDVTVEAVRIEGASVARPAPGVLEAIAEAESIVIAPSNPVVSLDPLLAVPGVRDAVRSRRDRVVAVSPIVAGSALKGPAGRLLAELGNESSVVGVARWVHELAATLVVDVADRSLVSEVQAQGVRCLIAETVMATPEIAAALARTVLQAATTPPVAAPPAGTEPPVRGASEAGGER